MSNHYIALKFREAINNWRKNHTDIVGHEVLELLASLEVGKTIVIQYESKYPNTYVGVAFFTKMSDDSWMFRDRNNVFNDKLVNTQLAYELLDGTACYVDEFRVSLNG